MNALNSIDTSKNRKLRYLSCYGNNLTSLNLTNNNKLVELDIKNNKISDIDVSGCKKFDAIGYNSK